MAMPNLETDVKERILPIDAWIIAFEETRYYAIEDEDAPYIEKIRGVYLFDANETTHLCEFAPSYYLRHLYDQVLLSAAGEALSEERRDAICQKYEHCGAENLYVHCSDIGPIIERADPGVVHRHGDTGVAFEQCEYAEQLDSLCEHYNCNQVL